MNPTQGVEHDQQVELTSIVADHDQLGIEAMLQHAAKRPLGGDANVARGDPNEVQQGLPRFLVLEAEGSPASSNFWMRRAASLST